MRKYPECPECEGSGTIECGECGTEHDCENCDSYGYNPLVIDIRAELVMSEAITITDWHGCYEGGWQDAIVPEAFAHPAKFSRSLIVRIIRYGLDQGYWKAGDTIGDCFGGVALGGIIAGYHGLNWIGVELEPRFVELGNKNLAMHGPRWMALEQATSVRLVQGDSRRFAEIVGEVCGVVSSPPYAESLHLNESQEVQVARLAAKGNHAAIAKMSGNSASGNQGYGATSGNIGNLPAGQLDAVVSSPPYAESIKGDHGERETAAESTAKRQTPGGSLGQSQRHGGYGATVGNIGNLKDGAVDAVVTSPPFMDNGVNLGDVGDTPDMRQQIGNGSKPRKEAYGGTAGQIGNLKGGCLDRCAACGKLLTHTQQNNSPGTGGLAAQSAPLSVQPSVPAARTEDGSCRRIGANTSGERTGQNQEPLQSSETAASAETADRPTICTSTTNGTHTIPEARGTTHSATSKRSVERATRRGTRSPESTACTSASSAEAKSGQEGARLSSATETNAANDTSARHSKPIESESGAAFLCAACAASQSHLGTNGTSTAPMSAAVRQSQPASKRTVDPNAETYWSAMKLVYEQVHLSLKPGGVCAIVLKDYISKGRRVPLCDQTCTLLESLGFDVFERCRCWLVKEDRHPGLFDGEDVVKTTERKSFFRRLAEKKGSPRIDWEEVIWCRRPI